MRGGRTRVNKYVKDSVRYPLQSVLSGGTESYVSANGVFYKVHQFTSTGTLSISPSASLSSVEYLVVAGGGSGGSFSNLSQYRGGGGGAGGMRTGIQSLTAGTSYTVTVGVGGTAPTGTTVGANGGNSVFGSVTSTGGGGGGLGGGAGGAGSTGGSGGGSGGGS